MQLLMVLLVSVGVFVLILAVVLGISYALGARMRLMEGGPGHTPPADPCAQFQADRDWYEDLPIWKRTLVTVWWLVNRYLCAERGCQ